MSPFEINQAIELLDSLRTTSQYEEAKKLAFHLISQKEIQEDIVNLARVYNALGFVYLNLSDYPKALEFLSKALIINEEIGNKEGISNILENIGYLYLNLSDFPKALEFLLKALLNNEEIGNKRGIASNLGNIGAVYKTLSDYPKALEHYQKALQINVEIRNQEGISKILGNIGNVYNNLTDYPKALEYFHKALLIFEEIGNKQSIAINFGNIGNVYNNLTDYPKALEYYHKALHIFQEIGNKFGIGANLGNIGVVYSSLLNFPKALEYYHKALVINEEIGRKDQIATNLVNIGSVYGTIESPFYDSIKADECFQRTVLLAKEMGSKYILEEAYNELHNLRINQQNFKEALEYHKKSITLKLDMQSMEVKKQAERFDVERKIAERDKQLAEERGRFLERESILKNILPDSVTDRLVKGENPIADYFETVSVLFIDLVGFTTLSSNIKPPEIVKGLNTIFTAFDRIATTYGLEKIKTIGDAYMAVCGVPEPFEDHTYRTAKFGLEACEILQTLELGEEFKSLQIRIGLHCGSVVAGIIGEKKFAYDVWGDSVNIASRMESNSEPGRIHISESFSNSISHYSEFNIIPRGTISIKGKGTMNTYWLERAV